MVTYVPYGEIKKGRLPRIGVTFEIMSHLGCSLKAHASLDILASRECFWPLVALPRPPPSRPFCGRQGHCTHERCRPSEGGRKPHKTSLVVAQASEGRTKISPSWKTPIQLKGHALQMHAGPSIHILEYVHISIKCTLEVVETPCTPTTAPRVRQRHGIRKCCRYSCHIR